MVRRVGLAFLIAAASASSSLCALSSCVVAQDLGETGERSEGGPGGGATDATDEVAYPAVPSPGDGGKTDGGVLDPTKGPGPFGALPGGYCCTDDSQCRYRHCMSVDGGERMCLDECSPTTQAICDRPGLDFRCVTYTAAYDSACEPPPGFKCLDPSTFVRGALQTGACCTDEGNGLNGHECEANLCISKNGGPLVCSRVCEAGTDCPSDYSCYEVYFNKYCAPKSSTYTCN